MYLTAIVFTAILAQTVQHIQPFYRLFYQFIQTAYSAANHNVAELTRKSATYPLKPFAFLQLFCA